MTTAPIATRRGSSRTKAAAKRFMDIVAAIILMILSALIVLPTLLLIYLQDFRSPIYAPWRVGRNGQLFRCFKLRSMTVGAARPPLRAARILELRSGW